MKCKFTPSIFLNACYWAYCTRLINSYVWILFTFFYNQNGETSDFSQVMHAGLLQTFSNYPFYTDVHPNVQKKMSLLPLHCYFKWGTLFFITSLTGNMFTSCSTWLTGGCLQAQVKGCLCCLLQCKFIFKYFIILSFHQVWSHWKNIASLHNKLQIIIDHFINCEGWFTRCYLNWIFPLNNYF